MNGMTKIQLAKLAGLLNQFASILDSKSEDLVTINRALVIVNGARAGTFHADPEGTLEALFGPEQ